MIRAALLLALVPLLCGAALLEHYVLARQRLQIGADVAAEHGARAVFSSKDVEAAVRTRLARFSPAAPLDMLRIGADAAIDLDGDLFELGLDSVDAVELTGEIEERFGLEIDPALPFEQRSINRLAAALVQRPV